MRLYSGLSFFYFSGSLWDMFNPTYDASFNCAHSGWRKTYPASPSVEPRGLHRGFYIRYLRKRTNETIALNRLGDLLSCVVIRSYHLDDPRRFGFLFVFSLSFSHDNTPIVAFFTAGYPVKSSLTTLGFIAVLFWDFCCEKCNFFTDAQANSLCYNVQTIV